MVFLNTLSHLWNTNYVKPLLVYIRLRYDETPTKVRLTNPVRPCETAHASLPPIESSSTHTKVMQVEHCIGVLVYDTRVKPRGQYNWIFGELPTALRAVQSTNGKNTMKCLQDTIDSVPGFREFAEGQNFKFHVRHTCSDSYSANFVAERGLTHETPEWVGLHGLCDVHKLYTSTKNGMATVEYDISGLLNLALALSEAGAVGKLRQLLSRILGNELQISYSKPPANIPNSLAQVYRTELFELFLPLTGVDSARIKLNRKRRYILEYFLNGELYTMNICHFCEWSCCPTPEHTWKMLGTYVSWALIPCNLHKFPRSRWTNWDRSLDWAGLLAGVHSLLPRVLVEFLTGKPFNLHPREGLDGAGNSALPSIEDGDDWEHAFLDAHHRPVDVEAQNQDIGLFRCSCCLLLQ